MSDVKTSSRSATIRHDCSQQEIARHLRAVAVSMNERLTVSWRGAYVATVTIELANAVLEGTVDASQPGTIRLTVTGPSFLMLLSERKAIKRIDSYVREQLGDKHLGLAVDR